MAGAAGVNVETVRFYQRKGLMLVPRKAHGSIRRYGDADLARLRFIRSAQRLDFSLDEVGDLLMLEDGTRCDEARAVAERKLVDVRRKLADLRRIETALTQLIGHCEASRGKLACPMIASLQDTA